MVTKKNERATGGRKPKKKKPLDRVSTLPQPALKVRNNRSAIATTGAAQRFDAPGQGGKAKSAHVGLSRWICFVLYGSLAPPALVRRFLDSLRLLSRYRATGAHARASWRFLRP
jgi:hypothetical protein